MIETKLSEQLSITYPTPPPEDGDDDSLGEEDESNKLNAVKKHPPLAKLVLSAIESLNKRGGSSVVAIAKYIKSTDYEVKDDQRFKKIVSKALKMAISRGQVEQVKLSFKLTAQAKNESKAIQKMKVKKEKKLEKEKKSMEKKKLKKDKPTATADLAKTTEAKKAKKTKPSERKTGQAKKPKTEASEGKSKKAAASATTSAVGKKNTSRKSIGTLAKPKATKAKLNRLSIKKLVAAKDIPSGEEDMPDGLALASSTPQMPPTTKGKGKRTAPKATKA
ncbi:histone H1, early embryonic [Drosophila tropicalis]|uniref:histone H1, early embryonic n=1 Tax=Drosophila tropicalis TaxID=46794 RepID=UPI0035ABBB35